MSNLTNEKVSLSRESINTSIGRYGFLGSTIRLQWNKKRRYRTI